jgi:hypothetical protein
MSLTSTSVRGVDGLWPLLRGTFEGKEWFVCFDDGEVQLTFEKGINSSNLIRHLKTRNLYLHITGEQGFGSRMFANDVWKEAIWHEVECRLPLDFCSNPSVKHTGGYFYDPGG